VKNCINIGQVQWGQLPDGWRTSLLSPFGKVISREEWKDEGWTNSDLDFEQHSLAKQQAIKDDFEKYFSEFGEYFLVMHMVEPHPPLDNKDYFEPLVEPVFRKENLTCFIEGFLKGKTQTFVFHLGRECFVSFGFDMSVSIYHKDCLPEVSGLEVLKLVEV
jgi:hypothetical protein